jgi:hypothetical protein
MARLIRPRRPFVTRPVRVPSRGVHQHRVVTILGDSDPVPSALTSTLTSSASSFVAGSAGVTLTFTARDASNNLIEGYTPVPESGVV